MKHDLIDSLNVKAAHSMNSQKEILNRIIKRGGRLPWGRIVAHAGEEFQP